MCQQPKYIKFHNVVHNVTKLMGFRARHEHSQLMWPDITLKHDSVSGKQDLDLELECETKSWDGSDLVGDPRACNPRIWATGHPDTYRCPVGIDLAAELKSKVSI